MERSYTDPFYGPRIHHVGNAAAGTIGRMLAPFPIRVKGMKGAITSAGTNDGCTAILRQGTTALGTATLGTNTAGSLFELTGLDTQVAEGVAVNVLTNHSVSVDLAIVYAADPDAAAGDF